VFPVVGNALDLVPGGRVAKRQHRTGGYCRSMTRAKVLPAVFGRCRKMTSGGGGEAVIVIARSRCRTLRFPRSFLLYESREP
jgi:hypothetical protein